MGEGGLIPIFLLSISSSWVNMRLHTENQLYTMPGSALKVCVVGGVESEFSDQLWLWPSQTIKHKKVDSGGK